MRSSKRLVLSSSKKSNSNVLTSSTSPVTTTITDQCPMEVENTSANVNVGGGNPTNGVDGEVMVNLKIPALDKYNLRVKSIQKRIEVEKKRKNPRKEPKPKQRPPPLSKYRRKNANARERSRMQEMNQAFVELKKAVPQLASDFDAGEDQNSKLTKITTLRRAVKYIAALTMLLSETEPEQLIEENSNSIENNGNNGNIICSMGPSADQSFICSNISSPSPSVSSVSSISSSSILSSSSLSSSSCSSSSSTSYSSSISSPSSCSSLTLDLQSVNLNNQLGGDNLIIHPSQMFPHQVLNNNNNNQINHNGDNVNSYPIKSTSNNQQQHESQFAISSPSPSSSLIGNHHSSSSSTTSSVDSTINPARQQLFNSSLMPNLPQINPNHQQSSSNQDSNLSIYMDPDFNDLPVESSLPLLDADCYSYLPDSFDDFKLIAGDMIPETDFVNFRIDSEILSNPLITSW